MKSIFMVMPTWKNDAMCAEAIRTLYEYTDFEKYGDLLVVANSEVSPEFIKVCQKYDVEVYTPEENLGWMRSINYGRNDLCASRPFFTMCNDDVVFSQDKAFWPRTIKLFDAPEVAGVGPISNYVMGWQYFQIPVGDQVGEVNLLIGFCATYRTSALVGILDTDLPGGDDLDLSIRMRAAGYKLLCDRRSFLYHYGAVTGNRVHSDWDSLQSQHKTMNALIRKHGMKPWYKCINGPWTSYLEAEPSEVPLDLLKMVLTEIADLIAVVGDAHEGSCTAKEVEFLIDQTRDSINVCEVGFNAGISACAMLAANPKLQLVSFDEGKWPSVRVAAEYLTRKFGDRFKLRLGDSAFTVPEFTARESTDRFDFTFIDGGHSYMAAWEDLKNLAPRSRIVMMDDIRMPGVRKAWDQAVEKGLVQPLGEFSDQQVAGRHWALGTGGQR